MPTKVQTHRTAVQPVSLDAQSKRPEVQLEEALNKERIAGDIDGAINLLKPLAEHERADIAARALVVLGRLYDRRGEAQARSTFERVVRQFPNQEAAKEARAWLAAHAPEPGTPAQGPLHETLWKDSRIEVPTPFPDGVFEDIGGVTVVPLTGGDVVVVVVPVVVVQAVVVVDVPAAVVVVVSVTVVDVDGQSVGE